MPDFQQLIESGSAHVWLYIPVAVLLGALHGLEPGHSKTMMAAFIIAIRGTIWQAVLLGLSAAISHSLIIWILAALALHYGSHWNVETTEPFFHLASAALILGLAVWMFVRTRREVREAADHRLAHHHSPQNPPPPTASAPHDQDHHHEAHEHGHEHHEHDHHHHHTARTLAPPHSHSHLILDASGRPISSTPLIITPDAMAPPEPKRGPHSGLLLDTGHGWLEIAVHAAGPSNRFRIYPCRASGAPVPLPRHTTVGIETARLDGTGQKFLFEAREGFWEATADLPEPHEFMATVSMGHSDHIHTYRLRFTGSHGTAKATLEPEPDAGEYQDAHERAHAQDIARRFANRAVTTPQIVLFGVTGGLMPCPAAFTILLVCLQLKRATLGFSLVGAFSFGLALTMVAVGVAAAWGVNHAQKRFTGFNDWMRRAPYISCILLVLLAAFMAWQGWQGLHGHGGHTH